MIDVKRVAKDMLKQRRVQYVTGSLAIAGIAGFIVGMPYSGFLAAASIIGFAVATIRWIDDEEELEGKDNT